MSSGRVISLSRGKEITRNEPNLGDTVRRSDACFPPPPAAPVQRTGGGGARGLVRLLPPKSMRRAPTVWTTAKESLPGARTLRVTDSDSCAYGLP